MKNIAKAFWPVAITIVLYTVILTTYSFQAPSVPLKGTEAIHYFVSYTTEHGAGNIEVTSSVITCIGDVRRLEHLIHPYGGDSMIVVTNIIPLPIR